ncbi:MAG: thiamine pyrophosphate-binding protein [Candidatus Methylomirabilales bacterium]
MATGHDLIAALEGEGFDFFTGVPCSLFTGILGALEARFPGTYLPAVREDAAVGIASGAYLAGRRPVVLMQNSGLGTCLNALVSLNLIYRIPLLLLVSWRGYDGKDAPEHLIMGEISPRLLETIGLPWQEIQPDGVAEAVAWAASTLEAKQIPVALLLRRGALA